ncbi:MAG: RNA polymerase sigma-70 factor [Bacteroidia bacterium]
MAENLSYFKAFYEKLQPSLFAFAIYILRSEADAKEIVNDVFVKLWEKRDSLGPFDTDAPKRLKSYAFQATKNAALNHMRKENKQWLQVDADPPEEVTPSSIMEDKENVKTLENWLQELPDRCRQVFVMSRIDGLNNREIADLLEISVKTVENQMTKALKFFRIKMGLG